MIIVVIDIFQFKDWCHRILTSHSTIQLLVTYVNSNVYDSKLDKIKRYAPSSFIYRIS